MNRPTLENLIILSVVWCNTWKNNKGQIHDSYLDEKSRKYLGINLSEYYDITIEDFAENFSGGDYKPLMPHEIMNNIKDKIDIGELRGYEMMSKKDYTHTGSSIDVYGLDSQNEFEVSLIIERCDDEYFTQLVRKYGVDILLEENDE